MEMARRFGPALARRAITGGPAGRFAYADAAIDQVLPPFSLVAAGTATAGALAVLRAVLLPSPSARRDVVITTSAVAVLGAHVLSGLKMVHAPASVYRSLLAAPRMVLWKVRVWLRVLTRPNGVAWVRTARNDDETVAS